jgi:DNA-binding NtrC family response regulator
MNAAFLDVLVVAPTERCKTICDAFRERGRCQVSTVTSYCELFNIARQQSFEIAIVHEMLSVREFRDCSAHIRRTWPGTKILVICAEAGVLDDPLYDDWIAPTYSPDASLATSERLIDYGRERRREPAYRQPALSGRGNGGYTTFEEA